MKSLLKLTPLLALPLTANAANVMLEDFEDNTLNFTTAVPLFYDTASDHFTITPLNGTASTDDGPYTGFSGNYFSAEDINDPDGTSSTSDTQTLTFNIDITNVIGDLTFSGLFAAGSHSANTGAAGFHYDDEDGIRVRAQIDGGTVQDLVLLEAAEPGGDTTNNQLLVDTDGDGIGDGALITSAATAFNAVPITGLGSNLVLTIEVTSGAGSEELAFDEILVEGTVVPEPSSALFLLGGTALLFGRRRK